MAQKRSVLVAGHRTSISLEEEFWSELLRIKTEKKISINRLITVIDQQRTTNLSSAIRLFILAEIKAKAVSDNC
tara:strand:- start:4 stop:225 length:222 start_codon:yes stop_codon:yes gene_type:complete